MKDVVVTGPTAPNLTSLDDLSGKEAFVRESSAYFGSLKRLDEGFAAKRLAPIVIRFLDEDLEDDDILQMVNADILPYAIIDDYQAHLWARILPLKSRDDLVRRAVRSQAIRLVPLPRNGSRATSPRRVTSSMASATMPTGFTVGRGSADPL